MNARMDTIRPGTRYDVVAFGAHPDDVEMAMGGTIAALSSSGLRVAIIDLTGAEMSTFGDPETRLEEAAAAARILGVDRRILDRPDGAVVDDVEGRRQVALWIRELRPRVVFTTYPHARSGPADGRSNVDHLAVGRMVREGCKLARFRRLRPEPGPHAIQRLWYYMVPDHRAPSFVVDVSAHRERLEACIRAYESQMEIRRGERTILDLLMVLRQHAGLRIGVELGEPLLCEDALGGPADRLLDI